MASSVVAALPLPPPRPAAMGIVFSEMNADAFADAGGFEEVFRGGEDEVPGVRRQKGVAALEAEPGAAALEGEGIVEVNRMQDGFQLVETVGALAQDVEEEVDLARVNA